MASRYYGASVGSQLPGDVVKQASTTARPIELTVDLAASGLDKMGLIKALLAITDYVIADGFPPS
jgi:hypothetical protein